MTRYLAFSLIRVKEGFAFRINLFTSVFGGLFRLVLLTSVWRAVYIGYDSLAGYGQEEMLFYVVIATAMSVGGLLSAGEELGAKANTGDIVVELIRPVSLPWQYLFSSLGEFVFTFWIKVVPTLIIGLALVGRIPPVALRALPLFLIACVAGSSLNYWMSLLFASFGFRTKSPYGISRLWAALNAFFAGLIVPITFYPVPLQHFIYWTPFPSIVFTPLRLLMGKTVPGGGISAVYANLLGMPGSIALLAEQFTWALIVPLAAHAVYSWNERSADIQGG